MNLAAEKHATTFRAAHPVAVSSLGTAPGAAEPSQVFQALIALESRVADNRANGAVKLIPYFSKCHIS